MREDGGEESAGLGSDSDDSRHYLEVFLVDDAVDVRLVGQRARFVRSPEKLVCLQSIYIVFISYHGESQFTKLNNSA